MRSCMCRELIKIPESHDHAMILPDRIRRWLGEDPPRNVIFHHWSLFDLLGQLGIKHLMYVSQCWKAN